MSQRCRRWMNNLVVYAACRGAVRQNGGRAAAGKTGRKTSGEIMILLLTILCFFVDICVRFNWTVVQIPKANRRFKPLVHCFTKFYFFFKPYHSGRIIYW